MSSDLRASCARGLRIVSVVAFLVASALSTTSGQPVAAQRESTCPDSDDLDAPISVRIGEQFAIGLQSNPSTGYCWQLDDAEPVSMVRLVGSEYLPPQIALIGAGGKECWTFEAVASGTATLAMSYRRPFEPAAPSARTKRLVVVVSPVSSPAQVPR